MKKSFLLLVGILLLAGIGSVEADVINAASCLQSDVQTAIDSAANDDIVQIPDGTCTWVRGPGWGDAAVYVTDKNITLRGNGQYVVDGSHIDTGTWPLTINFDIVDGSCLRITGTSDQFIRVTGIHFAGSVPGGTSRFGALEIGPSNEA